MSQEEKTHAEHEQSEQSEQNPLDRRSRKKTATVITAAVVVCALLVVLGIVVWKTTHGSSDAQNINTENANTNTAVEVLPKKLPRRIDGVEVDAEKANFYPYAVMIENAAFGGVRPQSGLQEASVVYEALAEGGITRFLAVFASGEPITQIGPVRSARPYYVDWAEEYQGLYVHAGGSPQALQKLNTQNTVVDLNQINGQEEYFVRDPKAQAREHGLFTSSDFLAFAVRDFKLEDKVGIYTPWLFSDSGAKKADRPTTEKTITIPFSTSSYEVKYAYNAEENVYMRSNGGVPHIDKLTGNQITVRNVVIQYVKTSILEATSGRLQITTVSSGNAVVFYDGVAHEAKWKKESESGRTVFTDLNDQPISFIPGNVWVEAVPTDRTVTYTQNE